MYLTVRLISFTVQYILIDVFFSWCGNKYAFIYLFYLNFLCSVTVENMKTDHSVIYITTTHPTDFSCFFHVYRDEAKSRKIFLLIMFP
jgi:hypothetical protein